MPDATPAPRAYRILRTIAALAPLAGPIGCAAPLAAPVGGPSGDAAAPVVRGLDDVARQAFRATGVPGAVVAVVVRDSVVLLESFAAGSMAALPPIDTDDIFPAGAAMPVLNALAALRAEAAGSVGLDRTVGGYVPDLPDTLHGATLAQLLTHRAGLVTRPAMLGQRGDGLDAAVRQLTHIDRLSPPGAIHSRSPAGVALAAWILQERDGRAYPRLLEQTVLEPLGMHGSTIGRPAVAAAIAQGYRENRTAGARYEAVDPAPDSALGLPIHGLHSTATDLSVLARALLNDGAVAGEQRIPPGIVEEALRPRAAMPGAGRGQIALVGEIDEWEGLRRLSLGDATHAHAAAVRLLPDQGLGVVVLSNSPSRAIVRIPDALFRHLLRLQDPPRGAAPRATADPTLDPAEMRPLAGLYVNGGEALELVVDGAAPRLRSGGLLLEVRASGGRYRAVLPDGRPALSFDIVHDDAGRAYIWLGDRALARQER